MAATMRPDEVLRVLNDPLSQRLLNSSLPAHLAYTGVDGFPRVVPIGFLWTGRHFVICTATGMPKIRAITRNPHVALEIDRDTDPPHILSVRGTASIDVVEGVPPEYLEAARKSVVVKDWAGFEAAVRGLYKQMARIQISPEWANLIDFETRLPGALAKLMRSDR